MPDNDPLFTNTVDHAERLDAIDHVRFHRAGLDRATGGHAMVGRAKADPVRDFYRRLTRLKQIGLGLGLTGLAITAGYAAAFVAFITAKGLGEHWFAALVDLFLGVALAGMTGHLLWETRSMNKFEEAGIRLTHLPVLREGYRHLRSTLAVSATCQAVAASLLLGGVFSA